MRTNTPQLLAFFDAAVRECLCLFMKKAGAKHSVGHSNFDGWPNPSSLSNRAYQDLHGAFFWWVNRFELEYCTLDLGYGDKEFLIEPMLYYRGIKDHFSPWEILSAATISDPHVASGETWVLSVDFMRKVIADVSRGLITHWELLSEPPPEIIDRTRVMRGKHMIFAKEEQRRLDRESACIRASASFHSGDFQDAVRLLEPYRGDEDLPRASAMLLEMAKRKIQ